MRAIAVPLSALLLALPAAAVAQATNGATPGRLFVYPANGQTQAQLDQDRYECHAWARQQSGIDPSAPPAPTAGPTSSPTRVRVADNPSAGATARGTLAGAAIGGVLGAHDRDARCGAVLGAAVGGLAGGTIEMEGQRKVERAARDQARSSPASMRPRRSDARTTGAP